MYVKYSRLLLCQAWTANVNADVMVGLDTFLEFQFVFRAPVHVIVLCLFDFFFFKYQILIFLGHELVWHKNTSKFRPVSTAGTLG